MRCSGGVTACAAFGFVPPAHSFIVIFLAEPERPRPAAGRADRVAGRCVAAAVRGACQPTVSPSDACPFLLSPPQCRVCLHAFERQRGRISTLPTWPTSGTARGTASRQLTATLSQSLTYRPCPYDSVPCRRAAARRARGDGSEAFQRHPSVCVCSGGLEQHAQVIVGHLSVPEARKHSSKGARVDVPCAIRVVDPKRLSHRVHFRRGRLGAKQELLKRLFRARRLSGRAMWKVESRRGEQARRSRQLWLGHQHVQL